MKKNKTIFFFTGISVSIAFLRFLVFVNLDPIKFVDVFTRIGVVTLFAGFFGGFFDQLVLTQTRLIHYFPIRRYALLLNIFSIIFFGLYIYFDEIFLIVFSNSFLLGRLLINRFFSIKYDNSFYLYFSQVTYGLFIFLLSLAYLNINTRIEIFIYFLLFILFFTENYLVLRNIKSIETYSLASKIASRNVIKMHIISYSLVFFIGKIIEYGDKFYCKLFNCDAYVVALIKINSMQFGVSSIAYMFLLSKAQQNKKVSLSERGLVILLYLLISMIVLFKNFNYLHGAQLIYYTFLTILLLAPILLQELRLSEINLLNKNHKKITIFQKSSTLSIFFVSPLYFLGYPFLVSIFYFLVRWQLFFFNFNRDGFKDKKNTNSK